MIRSVLLLGATITVLIVVGLWFVWQHMQTQLNTPITLADDTHFVIQPGQNLADVAHRLTENGWLSHPNYLIFTARRTGKANQIKSGEYPISKGTTPLQLLDQFVEGKVIQHSLTLVEGWNLRQIEDAIRSSEILEQTITDWSGANLIKLLNIPHASAEGLIYPDTYHFPRGTTDLDFLQRAYDRLQAVLQQEWEKRASELPYQSAYEALIMASIIEKETGVAEERPQIAGVFVRRLNKGMKLQTDPTVIYAMGENFDGNIRRKDLKIDSPFNTYVYPGLPPTPIAAVGRAAIHAALNPESGKSLYFVSRGDGTHYFSETLAEHNRAVRKYQLKK